MRPFPACAVLLAVCPTLKAAPPVNDSFASRLSLAGSVVHTTGTNIEATVEANENIRNGLFGKTVWWSWVAPSSGWARVDTADSDFDTVLQISTGATVAGQTVVAFNDQAPGGGLADASRIHFMAVAGTVYNIVVGGWDESFGGYEGNIELHIMTGSVAVPPWFPATLTFTPPSADVTNAPVDVRAAFTIQSVSGTAKGTAQIGFDWDGDGENAEFIGPPAAWDASLPQSGSPQVNFTVPRFTAAGTNMVWFKIIPDDGGEIIFSAPDGGSGYALPPAPAVTQSVQVINNGPSDGDAPQLTVFSITPETADVTTAPASLQVSATLTDAPGGVARVKISLIPERTAVRRLITTLALSSGTIQNGTWTGSVAVPLLYPTDNYSVLVEAVDIAGNTVSYGLFGSNEMPGGDVNVSLIGGSAYEAWAYTSPFAPGDPMPGVLDDADSDGKPNLISYAFNLDPHHSARGPGYLPIVELAGTAAARHLRITFLRRRSVTNSGLTYSPQFSASLTGVWQTVAGGAISVLDDTWEQVVIDDPVNVSAEARRFARVKVEYDAP